MCFPLVLVFLLGPILLALLLLITCAPAEVPYLLLTRPEEFRAFWVGWVMALAAAPFLAYWLAGCRPAPTQRLKARRAEDRQQVALLDTEADRRARKRRRLLQTAIILPVTSAVGLVSIESTVTAENTMSFWGFIMVLAVEPVTVLVLTRLFWLWDRSYPPLGETVTVQQIRESTAEAARLLGPELSELEEIRAYLHRLTAQPDDPSVQRAAELATHAPSSSVQTSLITLSAISARAELMARPRSFRRYRSTGNLAEFTLLQGELLRGVRALEAASLDLASALKDLSDRVSR